MKLFVPDDIKETITMWTFEWAEGDFYYLKAESDTGTKYLRITDTGLSLADSKAPASRIQVVPGTGIHVGEICLKSESGVTLMYSGNKDTGFGVSGDVGNEWLHFVSSTEDTSGYVKTYSASKISVSEPDPEKLTTGTKVLLYTRVWNEEFSQYDFYAVNSKGELVPCFESGDSIEWVGGTDNDMLWQFTQYTYDDGTWTSYCELYNPTTEKYIAPQVEVRDSEGNIKSPAQILADDPVGIILSGRRNGEYYTSILTWDQGSYSYSGLRADETAGKIAPCSIWDTIDTVYDTDFYFAVMEEVPVDDTLYKVGTIDNDLYGITMKMVDIGTRDEMSYILDNNDGGLVTKTIPGLLSTNLGDDGYPIAARGSLGTLFANENPVNHLFIESTYLATGYYEYDSAENFASLRRDEEGNLLVDSGGKYNFDMYKELGTSDYDGRITLKHGQFFPYDQIEPGRFASVNKENLYSPKTNQQLPDSDPRKHEQLYLIKNQTPDYYFGMELEAGFIQTPSGLDAWGHDIIFEFSGDDDFWLYVDGELVIDLGGIHSAVPGSVNFKTGEVKMIDGRGKEITTNLREIFENNYRSRNLEADEQEVQNYLNGIFVPGKNVFLDDTPHTMRIFYFERGAGASNLHMRFNLATAQKGTVQLTKKLGGVDSTESTFAEFPYQIVYTLKDDETGTEHYLTNSLPGSTGSTQGGEDPYDYVLYKDSINAVKYKESIQIDGVTYQNVFLLKPDETAVISFPGEVDQYRIIECGVNTDVYSQVKVNGTEITGTQVYEGEATYADNRMDFAIGDDTTEHRPNVEYMNMVDKLQTLEVEKKLYYLDEYGDPVPLPDERIDPNGFFTFRVYFGTEFDEDPDSAAYIYQYHVKDPNGNYCKRDPGEETFVPLWEGATNYEEFTLDQKRQVSFQSGTGGSVSDIPANYTVEFRELLVGTQFKVVERSGETPDGYRYLKYEESQIDSATGIVTGDVLVVTGNGTQNGGITGAIAADENSHVDVSNIMGCGLRVKKVWADADTVSDRESTWFAVFTKDANGDLTYVDDTLRAMALKDEDGKPVSQTLYWYFDKLPQGAAELEDCVVCEVTVTEAGGIQTITPVPEGGYVGLTVDNAVEPTVYQVTYDEVEEGSESVNNNVLVYPVTDTPDNPSILLKKTQWDGETPLAGAEFTLVDGEGTQIGGGTYTSGADGLIVEVFPKVGMAYTLTEITSPEYWFGLEYPITFCLNEDGNVTVETDCGEACYILTQRTEGSAGSSGEPATLTVKNRPYTFQAVKVDGQTNQAMEDVVFSLYRYTSTAAGSQFVPVDGYSDLTTGADGVIPEINRTLPPGTYRLQETTPAGYQPLSQDGTSYVEFTISETGTISPGSSEPDGVSLVRSESEDGTVSYVLTIENYPQISIRKVDETGSSLKGATFLLNKWTTAESSRWTPYRDSRIPNGVIDLTDNAQKDITYLPDGRYQLVETDPPGGYIITNGYYYFEVKREAGSPLLYLTDADGSPITEAQDITVSAPNNIITLTVVNHPGTPLPSAGGSGTSLSLFLGSALTLAGGLVILRRRLG